MQQNNDVNSKGKIKTFKLYITFEIFSLVCAINLTRHLAVRAKQAHPIYILFSQFLKLALVNINYFI